jgi:hypothetical protein
MAGGKDSREVDLGSGRDGRWGGGPRIQHFGSYGGRVWVARHLFLGAHACRVDPAPMLALAAHAVLCEGVRPMAG